jgi:hypothetical protein
MNALYKVILSCLALMGNVPMQGQIGCIDNSEHLQKSGDAKQYHYVSCNCPCDRYTQIADRNKCTKCNHYHDIKPYIIISRSKAKTQ